jgi:nucleotide-binding universal stress UspA family protein
MYKKILVPVDGSKTSMKGLQEAIRLARGCKAKLRLVHVVDESMALRDSAFSFAADSILEMLAHGGRKALDSAAALARKQGITPETVLIESFSGRIAEAVAAEARKWRADLLVLGTHGRRGISHLVLGSDAELVVRMAPAPVLLVRGSTPAKARR